MDENRIEGTARNLAVRLKKDSVRSRAMRERKLRA